MYERDWRKIVETAIKILENKEVGDYIELWEDNDSFSDYVNDDPNTADYPIIFLTDTEVLGIIQVMLKTKRMILEKDDIGLKIAWKIL